MLCLQYLWICPFAALILDFAELLTTGGHGTSLTESSTQAWAEMILPDETNLES